MSLRCCYLRRSHSSILNTSSIDFSNRNLPSVTGKGPFVDFPKLDLIDSSGAILNIQFPESGYLNIRTASIVALNGKADIFVAGVNLLKPGVWYLSILLKSPVSLLVSGGDLKYLLLNTQRGDKWIIKSFESVAAWSEHDLPVFLNECKDSSLSSLHSEGGGTIVLQSIMKPFEVNIEPGEQILVNANSLLACNVSMEKQVSLLEDSPFNKLLNSLAPVLKSSLDRLYGNLLHHTSDGQERLLAYLSFTRFASIRNALHAIKSSLLVKRIIDFTKSTLRALFRNQGVLYYKIEGPAKLIVSEQRRSGRDP